MSISATEIKTRIIEAFQSAQYPSGTITVSDDVECREIEMGFNGRQWMSLSPADIRRYADALPLLSPEAFRYYFPAYMIACVDARSEIDVAWDSVIFNLTPPKSRRGPAWDSFRLRTGGFDAKQVDAIQAFVEFIREMDANAWAASGRVLTRDRIGPALQYWSGLRGD